MRTNPCPFHVGIGLSGARSVEWPRFDTGDQLALRWCPFSTKLADTMQGTQTPYWRIRVPLKGANPKLSSHWAQFSFSTQGSMGRFYQERIFFLFCSDRPRNFISCCTIGSTGGLSAASMALATRRVTCDSQLAVPSVYGLGVGFRCW